MTPTRRQPTANSLELDSEVALKSSFSQPYCRRDPCFSLSDHITTLRLKISMESLGHLLRTNQAPNDDERGRLKETLAGNDETLSAITEKISALEEQLRSLNEEKAALLEASAPVRWALSPFRQLPEDVVRAIFVACLETRWNPTMANTEAPVLLTQISRATRMIALTTPELWAAIHIPILVAVPLEAMDTAESIMTARTEGVKEWLRRSRNLPLSISVYEKLRVRGATHSLRFEIADALIGVLAACCSRWKNMHFSCRSTNLSQLSSLNEVSVPLLRSLGIFSSSSSDDEDLVRKPVKAASGHPREGGKTQRE